ncbi:MAG TPA: helix-turn-helix domain-containing protein [Acidimicrobiales bacterium]
MDGNVQQQARALGDPTRHAIFRSIAAARAPVGVADLNREFPLNHNAIRQHLAKLVAAGLVVGRTSPPPSRGRPRLEYEIHPAVGGRWGTSGPYERLGRLLVEIIRSGRAAVDVGRGAAPQFRVAEPSGDAVADLGAAMARQGFDPEVRAVRSGAEVVLHTCPFASVALADRHTVCALHLGIAEGLTEHSDVKVTGLVAYDPRKAECRIRLDLRGTEPRPRPTLELRGRVGRR